jgi:hypothetical protein
MMILGNDLKGLHCLLTVKGQRISANRKGNNSGACGYISPEKIGR